MVIHLLTNASVLDGPASFQQRVYAIHSLGAVLPLVEWTFIFLPLIYHAVFGILITRGALPNSSTYKYASNVRYTLQRATGMIAFVFIFWHVFHMHGWFHFDAWEKGVAEPLLGAQFRAYNAASTAASALQSSIVVQILYTIGVLSCVFHLANGIWTFGITWGLWLTPASQRWATRACLVFGLLLAMVSMGALGGFTFGVNVKEAREIEKSMYDAKVAAKEISPNEHKLAHPKQDESDKPTETAAISSSLGPTN
jgi:succinate dehydrogenase / fumarate reductase cytochrome b subunit